jgi:RimJ/RimL family protein N-acetyltransferase
MRDGDIELRPLRREDAEAHKAGEDDEQIRAFEFPGPAPIENVVSAIGRWQESWMSGGPVRNFGIWLATPPTLIGNVEVNLESDERVNLSYLVFPAWRRQGIATRAARLALAYAGTEMGATTAKIAVLDSNPASMGVARSLGAVQIGQDPRLRRRNPDASSNSIIPTPTVSAADAVGPGSGSNSRSTSRRDRLAGNSADAMLIRPMIANKRAYQTGIRPPERRRIVEDRESVAGRRGRSVMTWNTRTPSAPC